MRKGRTRFAAALVLAAALAGPAPPALAADGGREIAAWSLDGFWSWLRSIVPPLHSSRTASPPVSMTQADCDRGIYIDPDGKCHAALAAPPADRDR